MFLKVCTVGAAMLVAVVEACGDDDSGGYGYGYGYGDFYGVLGPLRKRIERSLDRHDVAAGPGRRVG